MLSRNGVTECLPRRSALCSANLRKETWCFLEIRGVLFDNSKQNHYLFICNLSLGNRMKMQRVSRLCCYLVNFFKKEFQVFWKWIFQWQSYHYSQCCEAHSTTGTLVQVAPPMALHHKAYITEGRCGRSSCPRLSWIKVVWQTEVGRGRAWTGLSRSGRGEARIQHLG